MSDEPEKREPCPKCGSAESVPLAYGGKLTAETKEKIRRGELQAGGGILTAESPTFACLKCGHRWLDEKTRERRQEILRTRGNIWKHLRI